MAIDPDATITPESIESDLRAGIVGYDADGAVPDRARAQATLGTWLIVQERTAEGWELLTAAAASSRGLGAERWLAKLPEEFREPVR